MEYLEFDLYLISSSEEVYAVRAKSPLGEAAGEFRIPFDRPRLDHFISGMASAGLSCVQEPEVELVFPGDTVSLSPEQFGGALFNALFSDGIRAHFDRSCGHADANDKGLIVQLHFDPSDTELARLPWELLYREDGQEFLAQLQSTPVVRYLAVPQSVAPYRAPRRLRVLLVVADPTDMPGLELKQESENIRASWQRNNVHVIDVVPTTTATLRERLREKRFHVLHFMGHGGFDEDERRGVLYFESETGERDAVTGEQLAGWLSNARSLRLVVLNACNTARGDQEESNPFSSVAHALVGKGLPAVVAMQQPVADDSAVEFSRVLYQSLADGLPLEASVAQARLELSARQACSTDWAVPVVFKRTKEIFKPPPPPEPLLAKLWTAVGSLLLYLSVNAMLESTGTGIRIPGVTFEELGSHMGGVYTILFCAPLLWLVLWLTDRYQQSVSEVGFAQRLPVAFDLPVSSSRTLASVYQGFFFFLFLLLPVYTLWHSYGEIVEAPVVVKETGERFAIDVEHLTKPVSLSVFFTDDYRFDHQKGITFFPFWEPWVFLLFLGYLSIYLVRLWYRMAKDE